MTEETGGAAALEEWPDEAPPREAMPWLAVVFGGAAIALLAIFVPAPTTATVKQEVLIALAVGLPVAALIWGIAWLVTLRHATTDWKLGTFAILAVIGVVAADRSIHAANESLRFDLIQLSSLKRVAQGHLALPPDMGRPGPITTRFIDYLRTEETARREMERKLGELQVHLLANSYMLSQHPEILDDCGRTETAKRVLRTHAAARIRRADAFVQAIAATDAPPEVQNALNADARTRSDISRLKRGAEIDQAALGHLNERCRILATRGWESWGRGFMFRDAGQLEAMNANAKKLIPLMSEPAAGGGELARIFG